MENLKSSAVTNLDATPVVVATAGEGAPGALKCQSDSVAVTSAVAQWSTYRLCRIPTNAKVKAVKAYLKGIDTNATGAVVIDFGIAFSDSATDGTPTSLQGAIPSDKHDGSAFGFVASTGYSTAYANSGTGNKLFGQLTGSNNGAAQSADITFGNTGSAGFTPANKNDDLWNVLGFVNGQGAAQDPGGFFDIFCVVSTGPSTAAAGTIGVEVDYVV